MAKIKRNLSTETGRKFWESTERIAKQVENWPDSRRAGINVSNVRQQERKENMIWNRTVTEKHAIITFSNSCGNKLNVFDEGFLCLTDENNDVVYGWPSEVFEETYLYLWARKDSKPEIKKQEVKQEHKPIIKFGGKEYPPYAGIPQKTKLYIGMPVRIKEEAWKSHCAYWGFYNKLNPGLTYILDIPSCFEGRIRVADTQSDICLSDTWWYEEDLEPGSYEDDFDAIE